ncbi:MAG: hypothetical protein IPJ13_07985 [Saprospiraceae bacterium]|nr:hypothetical protein [Saprospiraceae bacterium]
MAEFGPFQGWKVRDPSGVGSILLHTIWVLPVADSGKLKIVGLQLERNNDGYFKTPSIGAVAIAESDPNIVYVGMGEHAVRV